MKPYTLSNKQKYDLGVRSGKCSCGMAVDGITISNNWFISDRAYMWSVNEGKSIGSLNDDHTITLDSPEVYNPKNLTDAQVGEGYRLLWRGEIDPDRSEIIPEMECVTIGMCWLASKYGCDTDSTYRVPEDMPPLTDMDAVEKWRVERKQSQEQHVQNVAEGSGISKSGTPDEHRSPCTTSAASDLINPIEVVRRMAQLAGHDEKQDKMVLLGQFLYWADKCRKLVDAETDHIADTRKMVCPCEPCTSNCYHNQPHKETEFCNDKDGDCPKCISGGIPQPAPDFTQAATVLERIKEYLLCGGLFNPECMEHEKVRDLILQFRDLLTGIAPKDCLKPAPDFSAAEVGDEVRSLLHGWGTIIAKHIQIDGEYAMRIKFPNYINSFRMNGKIYKDDLHPCLVELRRKKKKVRRKISELPFQGLGGTTTNYIRQEFEKEVWNQIKDQTVEVEE